MKKIGLFLVMMGFSSGVVYADQTPPAIAPRVEITSWIPIGGSNNSRLGEVCGKVTGFTEPSLALRIRPDYNTKAPGNYNTFVSVDGRFCQVVMTYVGTVEVTVLDGRVPGTFVDQAQF